MGTQSEEEEDDAMNDVGEIKEATKKYVVDVATLVTEENEGSSDVPRVVEAQTEGADEMT